MFKKLGEWFKGLFNKKPTASPVVQPVKPVVLEPKEITPELVRTTFVKNMRKFNGQRETNGKNRSTWIDTINKWIGVSFGSPYCATAASRALADTEIELGIKIHIKKSASTQSMWWDTDAKYRVKVPYKGCIGIMYNYSNGDQGHAFIVEGSPDSSGNMPTFECNTDASGNRDGDGCMISKRNIKGDSSKGMRGFLDVGLAYEIVSKNVDNTKRISLYWENTTEPHPERKPWSDEVMNNLKNHMSLYASAKDIYKLHDSFASLTLEQKMKVIGEFWVALSYYESSFNPKSESVDVGTKGDKGSWSVGLYQMSGNDSAAKAMGASYETLKDPIMNIKVAMEQMRRQLTNTQTIFLDNSSKYRYWAVALIGNKYTQVNNIIARVKKYASF